MRHRYAPGLRREIAERWPAWSLHLAPIRPANELFDRQKKLVLINPEGDEDWAVAHVWAHFELGHHLRTGPFTCEEQEDADALAVVRLGLVDWGAWQPGTNNRGRMAG